MHRIGFMQGRLSELVDGKIQAFPWANWKNEFHSAKKIGLGLMEWTLDHENIYENPLLSKNITEIKVLCDRYNIKISSLTGDCFMQAPFWKSNDNGLIDILTEVIKACGRHSIKLIVIPLVDNGSINSKKEEDKLFAILMDCFDELSRNNVKIAFETDYEPLEVKRLINRFPHEYFGINYDIGNSAALGYDYKNEIEIYCNNILNVHVKDRKFEGGTVQLGKGDAKLQDTIKLLEERKYSGNYILQIARSKDNNHLDVIYSAYRTIEKWI